MDAQTNNLTAKKVCEKLKNTPYKFTAASQLRDAIRQLPEEQMQALVADLRCALGDAGNLGISRPLREIVSALPN